MLTAALAVGAVGVASPAVQIPAEAARLVLAWEIDHAPADRVLCIEVAANNPTPVLLTQLQRKDRTVVPASECRLVMNVRLGSYYLKTKQKANFLAVWNPKWRSASSLELEAEEYHHGLYAVHWTVELILQNGRWEIANTREDWIS